jgi:hypothetical protein
MKYFKYMMSALAGMMAVLIVSGVVGAANPNIIESIAGKGEVENARFDISLHLFDNGFESVKIKAKSTNPSLKVEKFTFISEPTEVNWETGFVDGYAKVWYKGQEGFVVNRVMIHTIDADDINFPGLSDSFWVLIWDKENHYFNPFGSNIVISGDIDHR